MTSSSSKEKETAHFLKFKGHSIVLRIEKKCSKQKKSLAINPVTKKPYVVWFVNNTSPSSGSGTFESPFPTLIQAQDASAPNDIIYVFTGDGTDKGMSAGIILQKGQQLLGSSISHHIKTTLGIVEIPAQAQGLPTISNTLVTIPIGKSVVRMSAGHNVVSGFNLVDNYGGGTGGADISAGIYIEAGLDYLVKHNTMSTFSLHGGGNCLNIYGGGNVTVKENTFIGRDTGDTYGVNLLPFLNPIQGFFRFEKNLFTGANATSGLDRGIDLEPTTANSYSKGIIGDIKLFVIENISNSQANTSEDDMAGIEIIAYANAENPITVDIIGNYITMPVGMVTPPPPLTKAGIIVASFGPGTLIATLHKNVSLNIPPAPGYRFNNNGNTADLQLKMGYDNFGTSSGP